MQMLPDSCRILDVAIHRVTLAQTLSLMDEFIRERRPRQIVTVNADFLRLAGKDPAFRDALNSASLAVADGMPLVWASRLMGRGMPERVAGVDLVSEAAARAAAKGYRMFFLGAGPGVAAAAAAELEGRYPGLRVAGVHVPPIGPPSPDDDARMVEIVRAAEPDMLFVALGAPRQEMWIYQHLEDLRVPVCMGVGGSFDLIANRVARARRLPYVGNKSAGGCRFNNRRAAITNH
jgi:N-acetylglucosaminyldiphosphoundecaprenol N-acetyl-beta-D-mannosaminyltransferase